MSVHGLTERERLVDRAVLAWIDTWQSPVIRDGLRRGIHVIGPGAYQEIRAIFAELVGRSHVER